MYCKMIQREIFIIYIHFKTYKLKFSRHTLLVSLVRLHRPEIYIDRMPLNKMSEQNTYKHNSYEIPSAILKTHS